VPGDPQQCRRHARNCIELAEHATSSEGRATLKNLADHWIKLAAELESAQTFLDAMKAIEPNSASDGRSHRTRT
jgi:hypothetical protein